jgi:hypothetical protein
MAKPYTTHRQKMATRLIRATVLFSDTTVTLGALKAGEVVSQVWAEVITAFNAGTTNVLTVGITGTTNKYLGTADVTEGTPGVYPTGGAGPFAAAAADTSIIATYAKTGTTPTTGRAVVYVEVTSAL